MKKIKLTRKNKKTKTIVCPVCGSGSLTYAGAMAGWTFPNANVAQRYICKNCGYEGSVALTVESKDDMEKIRKHGEWLRRHGKIDHKLVTQPIFTKEWIWMWRAVIACMVVLTLIMFFIIAIRSEWSQLGFMILSFFWVVFAIIWLVVRFAKARTKQGK